MEAAVGKWGTWKEGVEVASARPGGGTAELTVVMWCIAKDSAGSDCRGKRDTKAEIAQRGDDRLLSAVVSLQYQIVKTLAKHGGGAVAAGPRKSALNGGCWRRPVSKATDAVQE